MVSRRQVLIASGTVLLAGCGSSPGGTQTQDEAGPTETATPAEGPGAVTGSAEGTPTSKGDGSDDEGSVGAEPLVVSSSAFDEGGSIPEAYTGVGEDLSPPLTVESVPDSADTQAIVLDDPDANDYLHWLIWNIPADQSDIPEGLPQAETVDSLDGARQGTNDFGELGYRGPLPPKSDGAHTYRFTVYAVDSTLDLEAGVGRGKLESALEGRVLDTYQFTGEFDR